MLSLCYKCGSYLLRKKELSGQRKSSFPLNVFSLEVGVRVVVERDLGALPRGVYRSRACGRWALYLGQPEGPRRHCVIRTYGGGFPSTSSVSAQPAPQFEESLSGSFPFADAVTLCGASKPRSHTPSGTAWDLGGGVSRRCRPSSLLSPLRCPERSVAPWRGLRNVQSGPRAAP